MHAIHLPADCDFETFRDTARRCLAERLPPEQIVFETGAEPGLFRPPETGGKAEVSVPRRFLELVAQAICHSAPDRFALLYKLLWRLRAGERNLLDKLTDPDLMRASSYARAVVRDTYRMHAYVRFEERRLDGRTVQAAWFEPRHNVIRRAAPFFVDRFRNMDWMIATPLGTASWLDRDLRFGPAQAKPPRQDSGEDDLWLTYYRATFNPARLRVKAMVEQMPKRHWSTMPETAAIPEMVRAAQQRLEDMEASPPDRPPRFAQALERRVADPAPASAEPLSALRQAASGCARCPLHEPATQTVFGEGPFDAPVMFVGEQPGDQEDLDGRPFVGPAGQMFDRALSEAGIARHKIYVTNAVKHFKFEPRGKRRIHQKPAMVEIGACRHWLQQELALVRPRLVVALGATAVAGLTGRKAAVTKERGFIQNHPQWAFLVTVHPSYLLRLPDADAAAAEYRRFVDDLRLAAPWCGGEQ